LLLRKRRSTRRSKNRSARKIRLQRIINQEKYFEKEGTVMEFEKLKKIIAEVLNVDPDEITMETTFQDDLGADSLDVYQIIMGIEEEFDIEIPAETAEQVTTVEDAVEMIKNAVN
jgi:acyl carrier protein